MKIVIDIPEEQFITLNAKTQKEVISVIDHKLLISAIQNGTPLPKGHGDLIDRNCFANKYESCGNEYCEHPDECEECNSRIIDKYDVDNIPVVIPADK